MLQWLKNAPVGVKVALAPALGVLCLAFMGLLGGYANVKLGGALSKLSGERLPRVVMVANAQRRLVRLNALVNQSLAWEAAGFKADKIEALDKRIVSGLDSFSGQLKEFAADPALDATEREATQQLVQDYAKFRKSAVDALDIKSGMVANAATFMTMMEANFNDLTSMFEKLVAHEQALADEAAAEGKNLANRNNLLILGGGVLATALAAGFAWLSSRLIVIPLRQAS
ncbi:MAG TPA: hypothetical protein VGA59_11470, partial [Ramlibacter sp.]